MFSINSVDLKYYDGKSNYNSIRENERIVEIPIGKYFYDKYKNDNFVELGAVLNYYYDSNHIVYDKYDPHKNCTRLDFTDNKIDFKNMSVLSISTLEHVGFNDYGKQNGRYSIDNWCKGYFIIKNIIENSKNYLITFPIGYNIVLDGLIENSSNNFIILKRISKDNRWEVGKKEDFKLLYGKPQGELLKKYIGDKIKDNQIEAEYNNANAICILTNDVDFLYKKMKVEVSVGEIIDKYTILKIKKDKINSEHIIKEFKYLEEIVNSIEIDKNIINRLYDVNNKLWEIEDKIREKEKNKEFDNEFIQTARSVYLNNDIRANIKKEINIITNSNFVEVKSYKNYQ